MKQTKKGFTLVELLVVIAILAILATVSVVGYTAFIQKAHESNDIQFLQSLNTLIIACDDINTPHDAFDFVRREGGVDLGKFHSKIEGCEILWDSHNEKFCYLNKEGELVYVPGTLPEGNTPANHELWMVCDTAEDANSCPYSIYYAGEDGATITTTNSFDGGHATGLTVNYTGTLEVAIIRMVDGAKLTISDTTNSHQQYFYGSVAHAEISTGNNCFHAHGDIGYVEVLAGLYSQESGSVTALVNHTDIKPVVIAGGVILAEYDAEKYEDSIEQIKTGASTFAGGMGTESYPFLIATAEQLANISSLYETGFYNYKIVDGTTMIDCSSWTPVKLNGNFDGNGVLFENLDTALFERIKGETALVKNFTINANIISASGVSAVTNKSVTLDLTIDSVDVHGTIIGASWVTPYVNFGPGADCTWSLTIKNSVSDATLVATSGVASGFVGHPYNKVSQGNLEDTSLITIIDSAYIGNMSAQGATTSSNFKYFTINGNNNRIETYYSEAFVAELGYNPEGTLYNVPSDKEGYSVIESNGYKTFFAGNYGYNVVDNYKPTLKKATLNTTAQSELPASVGSTFAVNKVAGAVKAIVSLQVAPNDSNNYGAYLGTYMVEEIDVTDVATGDTFNTEDIKYFEININSGVTSQTGVSGNIFNIVNSAYGVNTHHGATVHIIQLDANDSVLNITSIQIA